MFQGNYSLLAGKHQAFLPEGVLVAVHIAQLWYKEMGFTWGRYRCLMSYRGQYLLGQLHWQSPQDPHEIQPVINVIAPFPSPSAIYLSSIFLNYKQYYLETRLIHCLHSQRAEQGSHLRSDSCAEGEMGLLTLCPLR